MENRMLGNGCPYASTRALEVGLAFIMITCGIALLWQGDTFSLPSFKIVKRYLSEDSGGWTFLVVGLIRLAALWVNGARRPTPIVRLCGCAIGVGFWFTMVIALTNSVVNLDLPGVPMVLPVSIGLLGMEFYSALRCGADASYLGSLRRIRPRRAKEDGF